MNTDMVSKLSLEGFMVVDGYVVVGWAVPTVVGIFLTGEWHIFYKAQTDVQKLIG